MRYSLNTDISILSFHFVDSHTGDDSEPRGQADTDVSGWTSDHHQLYTGAPVHAYTRTLGTTVTCSSAQGLSHKRAVPWHSAFECIGGRNPSLILSRFLRPV